MRRCINRSSSTLHFTQLAAGCYSVGLHAQPRQKPRREAGLVANSSTGLPGPWTTPRWLLPGTTALPGGCCSACCEESCLLAQLPLPLPSLLPPSCAEAVHTCHSCGCHCGCCCCCCWSARPPFEIGPWVGVVGGTARWTPVPPVLHSVPRVSSSAQPGMPAQQAPCLQV